MMMFRRRYVTDARYQFRFTISLLRGLALAISIPACILLAVFLAVARTAPPASKAALLSGLPSAIGLFLVVAASLVAASILIGIVLSHRYVGPLKRVEAWSARYLLGQPAGKLTLRKGDELSDIVARISEMVEPEKRP
jgi:hypothetical protein